MYWTKTTQYNADAHTDTHLGDVLDEVLAEGEPAADEPHGNDVMGQGHDVLVEPGEKTTFSSEV